ncbi:MAG TPA: hypothetical protein VED43_10270 [Mycobacterium sp.]|nr:hypothetical protein [Mycobacterium sp.]
MTELFPVSAGEPDLRCRITVVAPSVVEVVKHAGGRVFDEHCESWELRKVTCSTASSEESGG